ncbi:MAG: hypothetical protein N2510_05280 [Ignavibacteria bacterium]|nr:hypothetical protein [Ignavibacteria bacterium]
MDSHAQYEIRKYSEVIGYEIVSKWCPFAWEAFLDYRFNAMSLTGPEKEIIREITSGNYTKALELGIKFGWVKEDGTPRKNRERAEFEEKLFDLGLNAPWKIS